LSAKEHEPITSLNLFNRLPTLVQSVFDDVDTHLPLVLALSGKAVLLQPPDTPATPVSQMRDLIGPDFRQDLHRDMATRFQATADDIGQTLGRAAFERFAAVANQTQAEQVVLSPRHWSGATIRLLAHYMRSRNRAQKSRLARACVPVLEAGMLGFLNRTYDLTYAEAFRCLDTEYLPAFQHTWESLSRRLVLYRLALLRRWPVRAANRLGNAIRRLPGVLSRNPGPGSSLHK
jgi:hypothetical protein